MTTDKLDTIRSTRDILLEALYIKTEVDKLSDAGLVYIAKKLRISSKAAAHQMLKYLDVSAGELKIAQHMVAESERAAARPAKLTSLNDLPQSLRLGEAIRRVIGPDRRMDPLKAIQLAQPAEHHKAQTARLIAIARLQASPDYCLRQALVGHWRASKATGPIHDLIELATRSHVKTADLIGIDELSGRFWEEPHHYIWIGQERARVRRGAGRSARRPAALPAGRAAA